MVKYNDERRSKEERKREIYRRLSQFRYFTSPLKEDTSDEVIFPGPKTTEGKFSWPTKGWNDLLKLEKKHPPREIRVLPINRNRTKETYVTLTDVNRAGWVLREHIERDDPPYPNPDSKYSSFLNENPFIERAKLQFSTKNNGNYRLMSKSVYRLRKDPFKQNEFPDVKEGSAFIRLIQYATKTPDSPFRHELARKFLFELHSDYFKDMPEDEIRLFNVLSNLEELEEKILFLELGDEITEVEEDAPADNSELMLRGMCTNADGIIDYVENHPKVLTLINIEAKKEQENEQREKLYKQIRQNAI